MKITVVLPGGEKIGYSLIEDDTPRFADLIAKVLIDHPSLKVAGIEYNLVVIRPIVLVPVTIVLPGKKDDEGFPYFVESGRSIGDITDLLRQQFGFPEMEGTKHLSYQMHIGSFDTHLLKQGELAGNVIPRESTLILSIKQG